MKEDQEFTERLCRLNGKKPTLRDRWKAFHRLWRLAQGHGPHQDMEAHECFHVLMSNKAWIGLMGDFSTGSSGSVNRSHIPLFLRKRLLEHDRKKRLYGGHYEWMERDKAVARKVHDQGIEATPTEVAEVRRKVINMARAKAAELDLDLPEDDAEVLELLRPRNFPNPR